MTIHRFAFSIGMGLALVAATAWGQFPFSGPSIFSVFNAASYAGSGRSNGGIACGSMFVVKGVVIGPVPLQMASGFPLRTELAGTSIQVQASGRSWDALMVYTSWDQAAAVLPSAVPPGEATIRLTFEGRTSSPIPMRVVPRSFGVFTRNQAGSGPGIVQNADSGGGRALNGLTQPARPRQTVIVWGTGLGPVSGDEAAGPLPGNMDANVEVLIGGKPATVLYQGRSGCCAGLDEIAVETPAGVEGCYVPVVVRTGDVWSNFATMSVATSGGVCAELSSLPDPAVEKLKRGEDLSVGQIELLRFLVRAEAGGMSAEAIIDAGFGHFTRFSQQQFLASQSAKSFWLAGAPSPGYCLLLRPQEVLDFLPFPVLEDPALWDRTRALDAGPMLSVAGPQGVKNLNRSSSRYFSLLGGLDPEDGRTLPVFLEPGNYSAENGGGGKDVGGFRVTHNLPGGATWTNRSSLREISRERDLTLEWSSPNAAEQVVTAVASSSDGVGAHDWYLLCSERAAAGRLTVPASMLSQLARSTYADGIPMGFAGLVTTPTAEAGGKFSAPGIDAVRFSYALAELQMLAFR